MKSTDASTSLRFGPYSLPKRLSIGDSVRCEYGDTDVSAFELTDALIQWYRSRPGRRGPLIVCGDLVKAIRMESAAAVAANWGVTKNTVSNWRRALGVDRMTPGTTAVFRAAFVGRLTPKQLDLARKKSKTKRALAKMSASKRGKSLHPNSRKALLAAVSRPKSQDHRQAISRAHKRLGTVPPGTTTWTKAEDRKLDKVSDRQLAALTGRTLEAVRSRRKRLEIPCDPNNLAVCLKELKLGR